MNHRLIGRAAAVVLAVTSTVAFAAPTRSYLLLLWDDYSGRSADLKWFIQGLQPQPAGRSVMVLSNWGSGYWTSNIDEQFADDAAEASLFHYDYSRLEAIVLDEPYWVAVDQSLSWDVCPLKAAATLRQVSLQIANISKVVKKYAPQAKFWVNFSEPEMRWQMNPRCGLRFNTPAIDVVGMDKYGTGFNAGVKLYADWLVSNFSSPTQQLALTPGVFFREGIDSPQTIASLLPEFFAYADQMNAGCTSAGPIGQRCRVYAVSGWTAYPRRQYGADPTVYVGLTSPSAWPILWVWQGFLARPIVQ